MTEQTIEVPPGGMAPEVVVDAAELAPVDDVVELQRSTARTARLRAAKDELRAAYEYAQVLTHSTSINPEFQAYVERVKRRKVNGQWKTETLPPLGDQAIYNLAVAIIYGDKLGWSPEESGMRVFSVHGRPSIEAKDAIAFITRFIELRLADGRTKPFLEGGDWIWPVEESDDKAVWKSRRNGVEVTSEWTMARAQQAQYTQNEKYQTNPTEMLRWKAAMEVARIQWMDVLRGIAYSREELELESSPVVSVMSQRAAATDRRGGVGGLEAMLAARKQPAPISPAPAAAEQQPVETDQDPAPAGEPPDGVVVDPEPDHDPKSEPTKHQLTEVKRLLAREMFTNPKAPETLAYVAQMVALEDLAALEDLTAEQADALIQELSK